MRHIFWLLALLPTLAHAGLKWDTTHKALTYKPGTGVYRAEFPFKNTGKSTVSIAQIQTGCACCTTGKVAKRQYAPGETGQVEMIVDVRGKEVPILKPVLVQYADGSEPTSLILEVKTSDAKPINVPRWNIGIRK